MGFEQLLFRNDNIAKSIEPDLGAAFSRPDLSQSRGAKITVRCWYKSVMAHRSIFQSMEQGRETRLKLSPRFFPEESHA